MTTDLILAVISLVGLLGYATVGVAVARVAEPKSRRVCVERYGVVHGRCGWAHDHGDGYHNGPAATAGALWPALGLAIGLTHLVVLAARGPTAWGTALARLLTGRAERRAALLHQVADRDRRIAELEREVLG